MAVYNYKKYKVSIKYDSKKTQGLKTGDIVRRQYFDGKNLIYSIMCVLDYGTDKVVDSETNEIVEQSYFIGALLEGDAPQTSEVLDFARITNLFDTSRSGALYLTGSDDQAPYMDVIDGIGRNESLCYPESLATSDYEDTETQYVARGTDAVDVDYLQSMGENSRVCHFKRNSTITYDFIGIQQEFTKFVKNPNRVLVSYKIKSSRPQTCVLSLGYDDDRIDGEITVSITEEWQYKLHAITVDYSGRHNRILKIALSNMKSDDEIWIADFNIILLSSITNFADSSKIRIGKLNGVVDPVFGTLDGYGGYLQKLYASGSAHVSGTLTAGDENGFGATFYAGKIHRNVFINSLDVDFVSSVRIISNIANPTGTGYVYDASSPIKMVAQSQSWLSEHAGEKYTFSFWIYAGCACQLFVLQDNKTVGSVQVAYTSVLQWKRCSVTFELQESVNDLMITLSPTFDDEYDDSEQIAYFAAPQLESGDIVTQYQPTDALLNYTEDYGAWFSRGGIGGTIQNPLIQLNMDGEGSVGTRSNSVLIKTDGSGHLANANIKWNTAGDVTFGKNVTMGWENLDQSVQEELVSKSIRITGNDTFTLLGDMTGADPTTNPACILLTLEEENMQSTSSQRQWSYLQGYEYIDFDGENGKTLTIYPFDDYWDGSNSLVVRCSVNYLGEAYTATFTVKKQYIVGYSIEITSTQGATYKNQKCSTVLTANVYYQGKLVDPDYAAEHYSFCWRKYHLPDMENEVEGWYEEQLDERGNVIQPAIDINKQSITLNYDLSGQDYYVCELLNGSMFPYDFPLIF